MKVELSDEHLRRILDHCRRALPNEGCGLLALDGNRIMEVYPTANADESPVSYTIPPQEHYDSVMDAESKGWEIRGAFHSHPNGPARMSATDMDRALEPGWVYLVVGLDGPEPMLGAWQDGEIFDLDGATGF